MIIKLHFGSVRARSLQTSRTASLLLLGLVSLGAGQMGHAFFPSVGNSVSDLIEVGEPAFRDFADSELADYDALGAAEDVVANLRDQAATMVASRPEIFTRQLELQNGATFMGMLEKSNLSSSEALEVVDALQKIYNARRMRAGQEFILTFERFKGEESLKSVVFQVGDTKEISIERNKEQKFVAEEKITPLERERIAARGTIDSSLYAAGRQVGVPRAVMAALIRAYSHSVDFQRDLRSGDKFEVLYDQPMTKQGKAVGQGVIIYAAIKMGQTVMPIYRATFADNAVDYFDEKGQSVKRSLLRTPVEGARMSSGYGMRRHPILGYSKMHKGVDFAAPPGTPIYAAGSGTIVKAGAWGAYGNYIKIRHRNGLATAYAHMKRFARGISYGTRVKQGDVIGFVGTTGRSTGPHLHYEVLIDGKQVNPMRVNLPTGRVLKGKTLTQFKSGQIRIKNEFSTLLSKEIKAQDL